MISSCSSKPLEVLVVGGGPAGAAAGILLARSGREVAIVEKSPAMHDKVCGEFLSGEAVQYLTQLGLDLQALGALPIQGVRVARRRCIAECELPFPAMSLTRRALDESLLALAADAGAEVRRGVCLEALQRGEASWTARLKDNDDLQARSIFLATGKHDVRGWRRSAGKQNDLIAFKMYFSLAHDQQNALCGWIELHLFPGGYAGLQLGQDGTANLSLLVNRATYHSCGSDWQTLLARLLSFSQLLSERLDGAQPQLKKALALSSIPYGMLLRDSEPGLWRLGDQTAVTPSFSGDGISIALHTAEVAAQLYLKGGTSGELARRLHAELHRSIALATAVSRTMIAAPALASLLRAWPPLLRTIAGGTRVPQAALVG